jgi:hypothetical protein
LGIMPRVLVTVPSEPRLRAIDAVVTALEVEHLVVVVEHPNAADCLAKELIAASGA